MDIDPLNPDKLQRLADLLNFLAQQAATTGMPVRVSPIIPLLEVLIDLCLQLKENFVQLNGTPALPKLNQGIKELPFADEIGNAKMLKFDEKPILSVNIVSLKKFFGNLAVLVSRIRQKMEILPVETDEEIQFQERELVHLYDEFEGELLRSSLDRKKEMFLLSQNRQERKQRNNLAKARELKKFQQATFLENQKAAQERATLDQKEREKRVSGRKSPGFLAYQRRLKRRRTGAKK